MDIQFLLQNFGKVKRLKTHQATDIQLAGERSTLLNDFKPGNF